jgi:putative ABC transport system permease protein
MEQTLQDIKLGIRNLRRTPAFFLTAVITLAVGIGLGTAVFTVADAFLLRPMPVRDQGRVVVLWGTTSDGRFSNFPLLLDDAREFAARVSSLERVEFYSYGGALPVPVRNNGNVFQLRRALVSGGYFDLLGARPVLGRAIEARDDVVGAAPVVVLSHGAWQRYFGGDSGAVGRQIVMHQSGTAHTIAGVMPMGVDYPQGADFWAPVIPNSKPLGKAPIYAELNIIGRLRPGASPPAAAAELTAYFQRPEAPAWLHDVHGVAHTLPDAVLGDVRPAVLAFGAAASLLLLITCINVANLLLVRGLAREREMAVRTALGAGRGRIVGQLLTESAVLALAGGVLGTALAIVAVRGFVAFAPVGTPRLDEVHINGVAILVAVAITVVVTLLAALAPAVVTSRVELQDALRTNSRYSGAGRTQAGPSLRSGRQMWLGSGRQMWLRSGRQVWFGSGRQIRLGTETLVIGQVALALVMLSGAGVIVRSLIHLQHVELAFDSSHLVIAELAVPSEGFGDTHRQLALLDRLVPRIENVPGVRAVAPVLTSPFVGAGGVFGQIAAEGQSADEATKNPTLTFEVVTPSYFRTFDIPVLRGRSLNEADREGAPRVAMLSASAARHYWPSSDAIGRRLRGEKAEDAITIVGIVPDTRYRDLRDPRPSIYFPLKQSAFPVAPMTLAIRTDGRSANVIRDVRRAITEAEPGVALASAAPFETLLEAPLAQPRLNAVLLAAFAAAAVLLAAVGLFGVMATMVRLRTRELGVRMALGATASDIAQLVLRRGMVLAAAGAALGLAGAVAANRLLTAMLFEVTPTDGPTLVVVVVLLLVVAALASVIPARSSARIEPLVAMRAE